MPGAQQVINMPTITLRLSEGAEAIHYLSVGAQATLVI